MTDILKLARIQILVILLFAFNKIVLRPFVLARDFPAVADIFVLSFSNFCEAIVGVFSLTYIGLVINHRWVSPARRFSNAALYHIATLVAGVYVILQEFKVHNLGGNNVYDPWDVLFSVIGLGVACVMVHVMSPGIKDAG